jgi:hypothetical protein
LVFEDGIFAFFIVIRKLIPVQNKFLTAWAKLGPTSYLSFAFQNKTKRCMTKITLLAQMIQLLPTDKFKKLAAELESNNHSKGIDSWTHLGTMLFCQS